MRVLPAAKSASAATGSRGSAAPARPVESKAPTNTRTLGLTLMAPVRVVDCRGCGNGHEHRTYGRPAQREAWRGELPTRGDVRARSRRSVDISGRPCAFRKV